MLIHQYCVSHAVCPFDTKLFANTHLYTIPNLFWALTDNKSRESNALQTKYINKFCLCSVFFLLSRNHTLFFVFFSFFSLTFIGNALLTTTKYIWFIIRSNSFGIHGYLHCKIPERWDFFSTGNACHQLVYVIKHCIFASEIKFYNMKCIKKRTLKPSFSFSSRGKTNSWMWKCHNLLFGLTQTYTSTLMQKSSHVGYNNKVEKKQCERRHWGFGYRIR